MHAAALIPWAAALGARVLTLPAGLRHALIEQTAELLAPLVALAHEAGVVLAVETHVDWLTEDPAQAVELIGRVPGLGLTLDPSHYYAGAAQGKGYEIVYPFVRHVHIRDAGDSWETIQLPFGRGRVPFSAILADLDRSGYSGTFVIEYIDTFTTGDLTPHIQEARSKVASLHRAIHPRRAVSRLP